MTRRLPIYLVGAFPALMLGIFFVVPVLLMVAVSFFNKNMTPAFQLDNYIALADSYYIDSLLRSVLQAGTAAALVVCIAFTTVLFITDLGRRMQTIWILVFLSMLCLSEVIIAFAWHIMLSSSTGLPKLVGFFAGLTGFEYNARSWTPSFVAVQIALVNIGFSVVGLLIYPQLAGRDRSIEEAARTLGTSPWMVFLRVLLPNYGPLFLTAFMTMYVYYLGVFVIPTMLGTPQDWNLTIVVTDSAVKNFNQPLGAAVAVAMLIMTLGSLITLWAVQSLRGRAS